MKIAYYPLHYGKEYLAWSIRSIQDAVDQIHILYTPRPSFGHGTNLVCPDTEEELKAEAHRFLKKPLHWHVGQWNNEGQHRDSIAQIARNAGATQILAVDADELWDPETADRALKRIAAHNDESPGNTARTTKVRFIHFWRSLDWVCKDQAMPDRLHDIRFSANYWYLDDQPFPVLHFGYAQSEKLTDYKWHIHGHQNELRHNWYKEKFLSWTPTSGINDVHPTCSNGFWNPEHIEEPLKSKVKELLGDHPYFGKDKIV